MAIKMDLEIVPETTYYFCTNAFAQKLPDNFKENGISEYDIEPISNAVKLNLIPDTVHIPENPEEVYDFGNGHPNSLIGLTVVISHIKPESLRQYHDAIVLEKPDELYNKVRNNPRLRQMVSNS